MAAQSLCFQWGADSIVYRTLRPQYRNTCQGRLFRSICAAVACSSRVSRNSETRFPLKCGALVELGAGIGVIVRLVTLVGFKVGVLDIPGAGWPELDGVVI